MIEGGKWSHKLRSQVSLPVRSFRVASPLQLLLLHMLYSTIRNGVPLELLFIDNDEKANRQDKRTGIRFDTYDQVGLAAG